MRLNTVSIRSALFDRLTGRAKPAMTHPTAAAFEESPWVLVIESGVATPRDIELATGAVYFGRQFKSLRGSRLVRALDQFGGSTLLKLAVATANRSYLIARQRMAKAQADANLDEKGFQNYHALARIGGSRLQPNLSADDVLTAITDSFPHWLWHASQKAADGDGALGDLRRSAADIDAFLSIERGLRNLWQAILWEGQHLAKDGEQLLVEVGDDSGATLWAAWEFRQQALGMQQMMAEAAEVRRGERGRTPESRLDRSVVGLTRSGHNVRLKLGAPTPGSRRRQALKFRAIEESYLDIFFDELITAVPEPLTSRMMLSALCVVADVTELLIATLPPTELHSLADVRSLSLPIGYTAIMVAIRDSVGVSEALAREIMRRLTIGLGDTNVAFSEGVWHRPLVAGAKDDKLHILAGPTLSGLATRQMERWLIAGGKADTLSKGQHGLAYEQMVRDTLADAVADNPILQDVSISRKGIPKSKVGEEVDLLVRIGNTVLVGEIKCFLVPSESIERFSHLVKLEDAAEQVCRKTDWLKDNRGVLATYLEGLPEDLQSLTFAPVVVLNHGIGLGVTFEDAVVTDFRFLNLYLSNGRYIESALIGPNGEFVPTYQTLYKTEAEAEARIAATLSDPPGLRKYLRAVRWRCDNFPVYEGMIRIPSYELDEVAMRSLEAVAIARLLMAQS